MNKELDAYFSYSAVELSKIILSRKVTSEQLVRQLLQRIQQYNPSVNAIVSINEQDIIQQAIEADQLLAKGQITGPLHGVPISIKDSFAVKGHSASAGFEPLRDYIPEYDATVVARLKEAGAIVIGKTNVPTLLMDVQTKNPIYGTTNNPWDDTKTSGGSSGGSAAALAAGLSFMEIGSDVGGSLRIPAHFCGVYSLKPTENSVSSYGHMSGVHDYAPFKVSRHMFTYGPMARSMEDLIVSYPIIAGYDGKDTAVPHLSFDSNSLDQEQDIAKMKVAWLEEIPGIPVDDNMKRETSQLIDKLKASGAEVTQIEQFPVDPQLVWETWSKLIYAELKSTMPVQDENKTNALYEEHITASIKFPLTFEAYMELLTTREKLVAAFDAFVSEYDMLILPVSSTTAISHMEADDVLDFEPIYNKTIKVNDTEMNYWHAVTAYVSLFNVLESPVVTMPFALSNEKLPIAVQCVGKRWDDMKLLQDVQTIVKHVPSSLPPIATDKDLLKSTSS
ncbi:amidase [Longirhabdus pacifica]|uniref:amidase n=1 Tax=Longirhabdus pacifica TaxID=2305227 RepID=UPI0013E8A0DD|nr:amidase [Longirhabdus pacifica]